MNKFLILISFCFTCNFIAHSQNKLAYQENIDVHLSADFLITGETLYYSIYCLNTKENRPSILSKLAYVELVGESGEAVLQTKISLTDGRGAGDFFMASALSSGNYTLIAYTKWMRNFSAENFFQKQITIVNPYAKPVGSEAQPLIKKISSVNRIGTKKETNQVQLIADQKKYSNRQKVTVTIKNSDLINDCRISLNVHHYIKKTKTDSISKKNSSTSELAEHLEKNTSLQFLPDLRGETIGGLVRGSSSHQPVANTEVFLSAPGIPYAYQVLTTDASGKFYISTKDIQTQNGIRFQVDRSSTPEPFEVILDNEFLTDYSAFKPAPFSIDTTLRRQIEQRNVYSQIENAYFSAKKDSVLESKSETFFGKPDKVYSLDDYTRFPTMEDVFREYISEVFVLKRDGKFQLRVLNSNSGNGSRFFNTPLILMDGIRIFDTETLMNYNPLLIKKIALVSRSYVYAGVLYDGILSVNTYEGNAKDLNIPFVQKEYTSWQRPKKYYSPAYNGNTDLSRIPDFRFQLFWSPLITIAPGQTFTQEFYSSDVDGEFLIEVKGFNSNGEAVNVHDTIEVLK